MAKSDPNWDDLHKGAGAAFDEEFNKETEDAAEEAENTAEEAENETENESGFSDSEKRNEQEKQERVERMEELFVMYGRLANADEVEDLFNEFRVMTGDSLEKSIKSKYRKFQMQFHQDRFSSNGHQKFSKETEHIAAEVCKILSAFYAEAVEKAKNSFGYEAARRSRISTQNGTRARFQEDIRAAKEAENIMEQAEQNTNGAGVDMNDGGEHAENTETKAENKEDGVKNENKNENAETENVEAEQDAEGNGENLESPKEKDPLLVKLEEARMAYAETEYNNSKAWSGVRKFFGFKEKTESPEVREEREKYEKTMDEYRQSRVLDLRKRSGEGEDVKQELADLMMMFRYGEVIELANARTGAKLESMKDTRWGKIRSVPTKIAEAYGKIPLGVKLGIAGAAFLSGSVAFMAGRRILGGIVAGVGLSKGYEALDQKIMQKKAQKGTDTALEEMESFEGDKFDYLNTLLDKHLASENGVVERMQNMLTRRNRGKAFAIAVGGTMAALGLGKFTEGLLGEGTNNIGTQINIPKNFGFSGTEIENPIEDAVIHSQEVPLPLQEQLTEQSLRSVMDGAGQPAASLEGISDQALDAAQGSVGANHFEVSGNNGNSVIKVLEDALKARGVENPGEVANRIVFNYADKHELSIDKLSHIKSASFDIEPGGKEGFQIKDLKFKSIENHTGSFAADTPQAEPTATYTETRTSLETPEVSDPTVVEKFFEQEASAGNPYPDQAEETYAKFNEASKDWSAASTRHVSPPGGSFLHDDDFGPKQVTDLHGPDADRVAQLASKREAYVQLLEGLGAKSESFHEIGKSVIKEMSGNKLETWQRIKNLSYNEAMTQPGAKVGILKTLAKLKATLGIEAIRPLNGGKEEVGAMVKRLTEAVVEKGGK